MSEADAERDERLNRALEDALAQVRASGALDASTWRARYPDLSDDLVPLLETLHDLDAAVADWRLLTPLAQTQVYAGNSHTAAAAEGPSQVGRYRILGRAGAGGMGTVYKAHDPQLERTVALKVPRLDPAQDRGAAVQRFLREARAAARIRHAHVCPIYDVGEQDGRPYVVMAYVEGRSLAERLRGGRRYDDPRQAAALVREVAEALAAVHAHGITHRDLKPGNILLDAAGQAVLTDFGLAHPAGEEHLTVDGAVLGTPAYMAPEQASGESAGVGPHSDLYSLGVVLYQMLTGRLPFEGSVLAVRSRVRTEAPPPPSRFRPDLDPGLEAIVLRAMAHRPEERYADARTFADDLQRWLVGSSPAAPGRGPAVVRVELPGGEPLTVTVDAGSAAPGKVAMSVREQKAGRKRRRLAVTVLLTFSLLMGLALAHQMSVFQPAPSAGVSFALPRGAPHKDNAELVVAAAGRPEFTSGTTGGESKEEKPSEKPKERETVRKLLDKAPIDFQIQYKNKGEDKFRKVEIEENGTVPEPEEGTQVRFQLKRKKDTNNAYGVLLMVNGENTFYPEERVLDYSHAHLWILDPKDDDRPTFVTGFLKKGLDNEVAIFRVLSAVESQSTEVNYGRHAGTFTIVVFQGRIDGKDEPDGKETEFVRETSRGVPDKLGKTNTLKGLQNRLQEAATPKPKSTDVVSRGLIVGGELTKQKVKDVPFRGRVPVSSIQLRYYKPQSRD
jgi:predicted Ser/Thr protein kinase